MAAEQNVVVRRYADNFTLIGRDLIIMPLDNALEALLRSSFMKEWLKARMTEHLEKGGEFCCRAETGSPKSLYRLATEAEIMELAVQGKLDQARCDAGGGAKVPRRSGKVYKFSIPPAGKKREAALSQVKGQGRTILELVAESSATEFTVAALEALLENGRERLKTKPERKLLELFRFHMSESYKRLGLVEVIEPEKAEEEEEESSGEDE
jgi:hypothetical protein